MRRFAPSAAKTYVTLSGKEKILAVLGKLGFLLEMSQLGIISADSISLCSIHFSFVDIREKKKRIKNLPALFLRFSFSGWYPRRNESPLLKVIAS